MYNESITDKDKVIAGNEEFEVTKFDFLYSKYSTEMFRELGSNTKKISDLYEYLLTEKIVNSIEDFEKYQDELFAKQRSEIDITYKNI